MVSGCFWYFMIASIAHPIDLPQDVLPLNEMTPGDPNSRHKVGRWPMDPMVNAIHLGHRFRTFDVDEFFSCHSRKLKMSWFLVLSPLTVLVLNSIAAVQAVRTNSLARNTWSPRG